MICSSCGSSIDTATEYWVDTHTPQENGPYFHLRDECWDGDPHFKYPYRNGVMPHREPVLTAEEQRVANEAADLWLKILDDNPHGIAPKVIQDMRDTAEDIRKGWCREATASATIDRVCDTLRRIAYMHALKEQRYHNALAGGGVTADC